jgi:hypothetical protein
MGSPPQPSPPVPRPESPVSQPGNSEHPLPTQFDGLEKIRAALVKERCQRKAAEARLAKLQRQHMTDDEKALQAARDQGRAEAFKAAGLRIAAAEFRALAAGKLADPAAVLEVLDLSRFVGDEGEVDSAGLTAVVAKLAAALRPDRGGQGKRAGSD